MLTLPLPVKDFMDKLRQKGFEVYVVGGAVRNLLLGKNIENWDFATNALPEEILKLFPEAFYDNKYGTVKIPINTKTSRRDVSTNKILFEITPFRKESEYKDLRHPEKIEWAKTLVEDLARRDFTINAMALRPISPTQGKTYNVTIIDPYEGQKHLKEKLIVAVGNPDQRFQEDALRLMRAIRFASELGFLIGNKTRESIQNNASLITHISWERIRDELMRIIISDNPAEGILFLRNTGLLAFILPELDICFIIPQKSPKRHHVYDVGTHLVMSLKHCPSKDVITRFATLLHDIGKAKTFDRDEKTDLITFYNHEIVGTKLTENIAKRLRLSNKEKEKLITLVRYHQFSVTEIQTDNAIRRFVRQVGKKYLQDILDLRVADRIGSGAKPTSWRFELFKKRVKEVQKEPFKVTDLVINGKDVMTILHIKPGPKVGEVLKTIFDEVTTGKIKNEREPLSKRIEVYK